ncbi:hypothetical protein K1X76_09450 [bacterium]|nr:hypothetical protein [bacterium]
MGNSFTLGTVYVYPNGVIYEIHSGLHINRVYDAHGDGTIDKIVPFYSLPENATAEACSHYLTFLSDLYRYTRTIIDHYHPEQQWHVYWQRISTAFKEMVVSRSSPLSHNIWIYTDDNQWKYSNTADTISTFRTPNGTYGDRGLYINRVNNTSLLSAWTLANGYILGDLNYDLVIAISPAEQEYLGTDLIANYVSEGDMNRLQQNMDQAAYLRGTNWFTSVDTLLKTYHPSEFFEDTGH